MPVTEDYYAEQDRHAVKQLAQLVYIPARVKGRTCVVCSEPTGGPTMCTVCRDRQASWGALLADRVIPLTYASDTETPQIRRALAEYKNGWDETTKHAALVPLTYLVWQFIYRHRVCLENAAGGPIDGYVLVPSGKVGGRPDGHPLAQFERYLPTSWRPIVATRVSDSISRGIVPDSISLGDHPDVIGRRIAVFEDTWTTGAASQSMAVALKKAGAASVDIIVIGRWVNDSWTPTHNFFEQHRRGTLAQDRCPVSGTACTGTAGASP